MEMTMIIIALLLIGASNLLILGVLVVIISRQLIKTPLNINNDKNNTPLPAAPRSIVDEEEQLRMAEKKRQYDAQLSAINEMLNYNADVAYGIKPKGEY